MYMNYMDYVNDACMYMFSEDQATLMYNTAQNINWGSNKCSMTPSYPAQVLPAGCNPAAVDAGITAHISPPVSQCSTDPITPEVTLTNFGSTTLTSVTISYQVNGGTAVNFNWTGNLAQNATENVTLAPFTPPAGVYTFDSFTSNPNGTTDENASNDAFNSTHQAVTPQNLPYAEDFEDGSFDPTNSGLVTINVGGDAFVWTQANVSAYGTGSNSAVFSNFDGDGTSNPGGTIDALVTPVFDFSSVASAELTFDVAYAQYDNTYTDSLWVLISTDCGGLYDQLVYENGSTGLATAADITTAFTPAAGEWANIAVDLSAYDGFADVSIAIVNVSGWGNNMYIDNINVDVANPTCSVNVTSTPASCAGNDGTATASTTNTTGTVTYAWSGGVGSTATVSGLSAGTYTVTITDGTGCTATAQTTVADGCVPPSVGCDTISNFDFVNFTPNIYNSDNVGTVSGNNGYGDLAKADYYNYTGSNTDLKGGFIYFENLAISNPATSSLQVAVWDGTGGTPGTMLASETVLLQDIQDELDLGNIWWHEFANPVALTSGEFFFGAILPTVAGDSATIVTNTIDELIPGTGWEQWSDGNWFTYHDAGGWGINLVHYMIPVLGTQPTAAFTPTSETVCQGETVSFSSTSTDAVTYSWSFPGGTPASSTDANPVVTYNTPGTYSVTLTAINDCLEETITQTNIITVTNVTAGATGTDATCNGICDGSASVSATGGTAPYQYAWSNGMTGQNAMGLCAGSYTVTATDANGCSATASVTIFEPNAITASASSTGETCAGNDGTASVTASGGTAGYTYQWSNGMSGANIMGLSAGSYTVTVTDANGCTETAATTVANDCGCDGSLAGTTSTTNASCAAECDGSATVTASGGTSPYGFVWPSGGTTATETGLCAGTYVVTITDDNGCTATATATITEPTAITPTTSATDASCAGNDGTASASATGGTGSFSYAWSNGMNMQNITGLAPGTYTVTVTDANGCTATGQATVNDGCLCDGSLAATTSSTDETCAGNDGTASASATGGDGNYTYSWSNGMSMQTISGLSSGTYTVTVTDGNGCATTATAVINDGCLCDGSLAGTVSAMDASCNAACDGSATITASGGTSPYSFVWPSGGTTATETGLCAGTYVVTITDDNGCTATATATITEPTAITPTTSATDASCAGNDGTASASATGGTGSFSYAWSNGMNMQNITGLAPGTYTVTVTDANGCTATGQATVNDGCLCDGSLAATTSSTDETCAGNDGTASASATGGDGNYTYSWSNGMSMQTISGLSSGTYTVTVTDGNGCATTATAVINDGCLCDGSLAGTVSAMDASCNAACDGSATITASGGTSPYSFVWPSGGTTATETGLCAGTYEVTIEDANGCIATASATVSEPTAVALTVNATATTCAGNDGTATASTTGGTPGYTYQWSNGLSSATISGLAVGTYDVTVTDANGCTSTGSATVTDGCGCGGFSVTASATDVNCNGQCDGFAIATATGGTTPVSYAWDNGMNMQTNGNLCPGTYSVTATDAGGCTAVASVTINEPTALTTTSTSSGASCAGNDGTASVTASGGTAPYTYVWAGIVGVTGPTATGLAPGVYTVTVTDDNGCISAEQITVADNCVCNLAVTASGSDASCGGVCDGSATATATGGAGVTYVWDNGMMGATITGLCAGTYTVTATDATGCSETATVTVNEPTPLNVGVNGINDDCGLGGGAVSATASGGTAPYSYSWSNGANSDFQNGLGAGTYSVTVTDANGCSATGSTAITSGNSPSVTGVVTNVECNGDTNGSIDATITGGMAPYTYDWNSGQFSTEDLNNVGAGTYVLIVTDANGCQAGTSFTVSEPVPMNINFTITNDSGGGNGSIVAGVSGGTAPYTFLWSNGSTSILNNNLSAGTYSVTVTDANGCTTTGTATVDSSVNTIDEELITGWNVYPNPNDGSFFLTMDMTRSEEIEVRVINVLGQVIDQRQYEEMNLSDSFDLRNLPQGTYFLEMRVNDSRIVERITVVR